MEAEEKKMTQTTFAQITKIFDTGAIYHTFSMGELLIAMLLVIIIIILLVNMKNWGRGK